MIATNEETLAGLFTTAIKDMTPRMQYKGVEGWKPYDRQVKQPTSTRRFRLVFKRPRLRSGGAMSGSTFEHEVEMRVRTDYAGDHAKLQFVLIDDFLQLRDVLSGLKASDNGLMVVESVETYEEDTYRPISESSDVSKVDHTFNVIYMRSIDP